MRVAFGCSVGESDQKYILQSNMFFIASSGTARACASLCFDKSSFLGIMPEEISRVFEQVVCKERESFRR